MPDAAPQPTSQLQAETRSDVSISVDDSIVLPAFGRHRMRSKDCAKLRRPAALKFSLRDATFPGRSALSEFLLILSALPKRAPILEKLLPPVVTYSKGDTYDS
jgi:hypothetical protein